MRLDARQACVVVRITVPCAEQGTESPEQAVPEDWLRLEHVVGGVFLNLVVGQNFVAVDGPLASNPSVQLLTEDAFLGQLVVNIGLGGDFVRRVLAVDFVHFVLVIVVAAVATKGSRLVRDKVRRLALLKNVSNGQRLQVERNENEMRLRSLTVWASLSAAFFMLIVIN